MVFQVGGSVSCRQGSWALVPDFPFTSVHPQHAIGSTLERYSADICLMRVKPALSLLARSLLTTRLLYRAGGTRRRYVRPVPVSRRNVVLGQLPVRLAAADPAAHPCYTDALPQWPNVRDFLSTYPKLESAAGQPKLTPVHYVCLGACDGLTKTRKRLHFTFIETTSPVLIM